MAGGNFGDCKPVGDGVWELRVDWGPGYRVYYAMAGKHLVLLLAGGDKRKQQADIDAAIARWSDWQQRRRKMTATVSRPHDDAVIEMLRNDPEFANEYLAAALDEVSEPGGQAALLAALRQIAEAQGMSAVAERAGIPRESLYRALSPRGNPTIKTLLAVLKAAGLHLSVSKQSPVNA
jgi:probable addiction module antidote protein